MNDGIYTIEASLEGGSGKAYIKSPVELSVTGGKMSARIEWSSSKYDLMIVSGEEFSPVNEEGNSVFEIPVAAIEEPLPVQAETLAMSEPHLIDYDIVFDASTLTALSDTQDSGAALPFVIGGVSVCVIAAVCAVLVGKGKKKQK